MRTLIVPLAIASLFVWGLLASLAAEPKLVDDSPASFNPHPSYGQIVKQSNYKDLQLNLYLDSGHYILLCVKNNKMLGMSFWRMDHKNLEGKDYKVQSWLSDTLKDSYPELAKEIMENSKHY